MIPKRPGVSTICSQATKGVARVPLARILRLPHPDQRGALRGTQLARRPEPALASRSRADQRRRVRRRLVRRPGHAGRLPQHRTGLERQQPARARRPHQLPVVLHAHPGGDRQRRAADELSPVPPWPLAVHAQRLHQPVRDDQARPDPRRRPVAVPGDPRPGRHRGAVLPGPHLRPGGRPAGRRRAGDRARRSGRRPPRGPEPVPGHGRDHRRREHLGVPVLQREELALAVLHHRRSDAAQALSRPGAVPGGLGQRAADRLRAPRRRRRGVERGARIHLRHRRPGPP